MTEKLVDIITGKLMGKIGNSLICFFISLFPILELRGGLIAASLLNVPVVKALLICIIGNLLPIPVVLLCIEWFVGKMENWKLTKRFALWLKGKVEKNRSKVEKAGFWGLVLFVGIPLPGTGAWTGSLVAAFLHIPFRKSFFAIVLGVLMAAAIMTSITYGIPWLISLAV